jgi:pimeloyl-ACP methyl ester carboxylesterase
MISTKGFRMRTMVLVHGAWHGSWCWTRVTPFLAANGVPSVAVDLPGHGLDSAAPDSGRAVPFDPAVFATEPSPVAGITLRVAADTLIEQIRLAGGGAACMVVAHSLGGAVVTAAAQQAPELFAHLVFVSAYVPITASVAELSSAPEAAGALISAQLAADPAVVGALRRAPAGSGMRELFYADVDPAVAEAAILLLGIDTPATFVAERIGVTRDRFGAIPHTFVVCTKDRAIPEPLQRRFVREIDAVSATATDVITLDTSHSPFLSRPQALADALTTAWR